MEAMSFLDNLENNLKSLEAIEDVSTNSEQRRERDRAEALASAPWAERLKTEPFAQKLMQQATVAGRQRRVKVNLMWINTALRLEARRNRLELRPGAKGITAVFMHGPEAVSSTPVDLAADPQKLVSAWMTDIDEQKRIEDEQAAMMPEEEVAEENIP
jgi:hypothetical protein